MRIIYSKTPLAPRGVSVVPVLLLCAVIAGTLGVRRSLSYEIDGFDELAVAASAMFTDSDGMSVAAAAQDGGRVVLPPIVTNPKIPNSNAEFAAARDSSSGGAASAMGGAEAVAAAAMLFGKGAVMPLDGIITSVFAVREDPFGTGAAENHAGIDIAPAVSVPANGVPPSQIVVRSAFSGTVTFAGTDDSYGNYLIIDHGGDVQTLYAHCARFYVRQGDKVHTGMPIALTGSSGRSTAAHLHFEVRVGGVQVDPLAVFGASDA